MSIDTEQKIRDLAAADTLPIVHDSADPTIGSISSSSLKIRIITGFAALTLAFALMLGIIATRISGVDGIPRDVSKMVGDMVLWWGLGAVIVALILGALFARQIAEPLSSLAARLQQSPTDQNPWSTEIYRNYAELETLTRTMQMLAERVSAREQELTAGEQKFREAFDLVGIGLTQVDLEGGFLVVNRRFCEMLGYTRDELIGKNFIDITHPDDRDADRDMVREARTASDIHINKEKRYMRKDGSTLWAQRSGVLVRDATGKALYGLGSIEDVSQYHASQETLRALNASLKAIVETSPLAIFSATPTGIVTLWNPAAEKMFGINELDVLGRASPLLSGLGRARALELRSRVLAGETLHGFEVSWERISKDGQKELREISVAAAPLLGPENGIVGILSTCTDITANKLTAQKLDEQLRFTQELLEVIPNPIFYKGQDGKYLGFNRAWEQFFNLRRDEWVGKAYQEVFHDEVPAFIAEEDREILSGKQIIREVQVRDGHDKIRDAIKHISRITGPDGNAVGMIGVLTDITDFKQVAQALEASEIRFRALTESAMDIVSVIDGEGVIRYQSPSVKHMLGFEPSDMIGVSHFDIVHRDDIEMVQQAFYNLVKSGEMLRPVEFRAKAKDGSWRILEAIGKNCLDMPAVNGVVVNTRDVTERRAIQERIQHLAFHDALTGLPNRTLMQDRITQAVARAERAAHKIAVMFIDIDNFKNINDSLGHDAGDDLLCEVATRLKNSVRGHDTIARQGGDEFIVLLDQLDGHLGATRVAQKILDAMRAAFSVGGQDQHVSGSIGIALYPDDGRDAPTLLKNADTAMFHGKALGKNTYQFFTSQMNIAVKRRAAMESNLRAAVKNEDFSLVYQPQIDLITGEIVAFESLVRWNSEDSGTMMPGEFIPLAEETGLINELGAWVLFEACRQNKAWLDAGYAPRRMAVNLSARQLADKGFIDMLNKTLTTTGLAPELLELEITESQVMRQGEGSVMLLNEIAEMGIHLAVDDFGTGYSSLSYLKRLPIGKLKIDQSFIRDITVDPNDTAIVVAIINMAKSLDLDIIAEGIETAGQLTLLRAKGCGVGQGYYFSVPLSASDIEPLLKRKSIFETPAAVNA
jgi:diguanylate cyclase (GGDEF)-like protein/PAS domain S-box-containing protein